MGQLRPHWAPWRISAALSPAPSSQWPLLGQAAGEFGLGGWVEDSSAGVDRGSVSADGQMLPPAPPACVTCFGRPLLVPSSPAFMPACSRWRDECHHSRQQARKQPGDCARGQPHATQLEVQVRTGNGDGAEVSSRLCRTAAEPQLAACMHVVCASRMHVEQRQLSASPCRSYAVSSSLTRVVCVTCASGLCFA
jgi:hypothetical protein